MRTISLPVSKNHTIHHTMFVLVFNNEENIPLFGFIVVVWVLFTHIPPSPIQSTDSWLTEVCHQILRLGLHIVIFSHKYVRTIPQKKYIALKQMGMCPCAVQQFFLCMYLWRTDNLSCPCKITVICVNVGSRTDRIR